MNSSHGTDTPTASRRTAPGKGMATPASPLPVTVVKGLVSADPATLQLISVKGMVSPRALTRCDGEMTLNVAVLDPLLTFCRW